MTYTCLRKAFEHGQCRVMHESDKCKYWVGGHCPYLAIRDGKKVPKKVEVEA